MSNERQLGPGAALAIWALLVLGAAFYGNWAGYGGRRFAITLGVFAFFLGVEILVAATGIQEKLSRASKWRGAALLLFAPLLAYLTYALGTNVFEWWRMGLAALLVLAPATVAASAPRARLGAWQDYAAMLLIWLPVKIHPLQAALWPYPAQRLTHLMTILFLLTLAVAIFFLCRRIQGVGYTIGWGRGWGLAVMVNFALIAVIVIPLGQAIGFIRIEPHYDQLKALPFALVVTLLFTAWPEEFLFRGMLQNLLVRTTGSVTAAWLVASVIFGFAHITNGRFPNWRYVVLATIAGIFYGRAWRRTGSLFPAALVHMLVDVVWHLLFRTL
jgi:membrane protease YdiL (CAAX protease family)